MQLVILNGNYMNLFAKYLTLFAFFGILQSPVLAQDQITGSYEGNNRNAMFEKTKNGDVRFYIAGIQIGSRYSCSIGAGDGDNESPSILKMNGTTGGYTDNKHSFSVEFSKNKAHVIVGKSDCIIGGDYKKTGGKKSVDWNLDGD